MKPQHNYSEDEIKDALLHLAQCGGNSNKASELCGVPARTLRRWREEMPERYDDLRTTFARKIEEGLIKEHRENALLSAQLQRAATMQALEQAEAGELKDPARTAREASIASGVSIDKLLVLDGRPNEIRQHADAGQALIELGRKLGFAIESTATEIPLAELSEQTERS